MTGSFRQCEFCGLDDPDRDLLRVFLASRGNMKELERHLGVSYPTARARFEDLLRKLGLAPGPRSTTRGWRPCTASPRVSWTSRTPATTSGDTPFVRTASRGVRRPSSRTSGPGVRRRPGHPRIPR